jgi:hypothetical protein
LAFGEAGSLAQLPFDQEVVRIVEGFVMEFLLFAQVDAGRKLLLKAASVS